MNEEEKLLEKSLVSQRIFSSSEAKRIRRWKKAAIWTTVLQMSALPAAARPALSIRKDHELRGPTEAHTPKSWMVGDSSSEHCFVPARASGGQGVISGDVQFELHSTGNKTQNAHRSLFHHRRFVNDGYKIFARILHPTLASFYCVAKELTNPVGVPIPKSEIIGVYATHVFVFAADRLDDPSFSARALKVIIGLSVAALCATTPSPISNTGACFFLFTSALVMYPQVKQIPYLKCFWVPLAFTAASAAAAGVLNSIQKSQQTVPSVLFVLSCFLYFVGNCAACDITDIAEDTKRGTQTIATKLGATGTLYASASSIGVSIALLMLHILVPDVGSTNGTGSIVSFKEKPATYGCILSSTLFLAGLLFRSKRIKDMDILNWLPLLARILAHCHTQTDTH